jgi:hypothetical protein
MNDQTDLLETAIAWITSRGLLGVFLAFSATLFRRAMGFDRDLRQLALSFAAALFVIALVAPGLSDLLGLGQQASAMAGAILGLVARPLLEALLQGARFFRDDVATIIHAVFRSRGK